VFPTIPPRVDYALTPLGKTLLKPARALASWAQQNRYEIQVARDRFDARNGGAVDDASESTAPANGVAAKSRRRATSPRRPGARS
jgi:HxlR-like helix-turn-helix